MDLVATVSGFPAATAIEGLPGAWRWQVSPVFRFAAALSADGERLFQLTARGPYDEDLVRAVLGFAREHSAGLSARAIAFAEGFTYPGRAYSVVGAVAPSVHEHYALENAELNALTYVVFPAYRCEFSGTETADEAWARFNKLLLPSQLDRKPVPFLKMRYDNTRTKGGSVGPDRGHTRLANLLNELALLEGAEGSFVEWENYRGQVWCATWENGTWKLAGAEGAHNLGLERLLSFAEASVLGGD